MSPCWKKLEITEDDSRLSKTLCDGRFSVGTRFDCGAFGDVFIGNDHKTNKSVAIKIELSLFGRSRLLQECRLYEAFAANPATGFPKLLFSSMEGDFHIIVIELLGPNLSILSRYCGGVLSLKTTLMIAIQLIRRCESLHKKGFVHRDLKPDNICMGTRERGHHLYLIDFGLSRTYATGRQCRPPRKEGNRVVGTFRFCSVWIHYGVEHSRRDDLESAAYIFLKLLRGVLPWSNFDCRKKNLLRVTAMKEASPEELFKGLHPCFQSYLSNVRRLTFDATPNYKFLIALFTDAMASEGLTCDYRFDWMIRFEEKVTKANKKSLTT